MLFGIWIRVDPKMHVLACTLALYLANTVEPSMCGGDAACYKITLTTCLDLMRTFIAVLLAMYSTAYFF